MDIVRRLRLLRNALWSGTGPLTRQLLDALATATVVIVVASIGARTFDTTLARTEIAEALTLSKDPMMTASLYYAQYGRWPEATAPSPEKPLGSFVDRVTVEPDGTIRFWFLADAHPLIGGRYGTAAPIVSGDGATLRWQLVDDPKTADGSIDTHLVPYAWRLEQKEP
ncbi:MAG: hypothetical protein AAGA41_05875 [Pseudomonadota bacterium]